MLNANVMVHPTSNLNKRKRSYKFVHSLWSASISCCKGAWPLFEWNTEEVYIQVYNIGQKHINEYALSIVLCCCRHDFVDCYWLPYRAHWLVFHHTSSLFLLLPIQCLFFFFLYFQTPWPYNTLPVEEQQKIKHTYT